MNKKRRNKKVMSGLLGTTMALGLIAPAANGSAPVQADAAEHNSVPLRTVYHSPATNWEEQATPLGNGFLGAMVFGGVDSDRIQINEHTLWSGGPGADENYDGGMSDRSAEENKAALKAARQELQQAVSEFTDKLSAYRDATGNVVARDYPSSLNADNNNSELVSKINELKGEKNSFGDYQSLGDINISTPERFAGSLSSTEYTNYERILDLDHAVATTTYAVDGVTYKTEYFVSNPDNFMAIRLTADKPQSLNKVIHISTPQLKVSIETDAAAKTITMTGSPIDQKDTLEHLVFAQQILIQNEGGTVEEVKKGFQVLGADSITIYMAAGTNYQQCTDDSFDYFTDENPLDAVKERISTISAKSYEELKAAHTADYQSLFQRVSLSLGDIPLPEKTTDELLAGYYNGNSSLENLYLEMVYYQFGRYLLIASSREGSLPANLQGIWADGLTPPWNADYHTNINVQMNYWFAEQTNLAECHLPIVDYINSLVARGEITANQYHYNVADESQPVRGWTTYHENNIWGNTAPAVSSAFYFPTGAAWLCQDIWEAYQYNLDKDFLAQNFDTLKGAALFWVDNLVEDERDHTLVSSPSYSPEHGAYSLGTACDQAIIYDLFQNTISAAKVLGKENDPEIQEIADSLARLSIPLRIGLGGEFLEWKDELAMDLNGDNGHRHVNQLFALHPGSLVVAGRSEEDDAYVEAMKQTLLLRGDGGTGWSKAWKINFWARLRDGDHAYVMVQQILKQSTNQNLFDTHPPFQIDGNFGATAGMTEMLLQSQGDSIDLLPALPQAWYNGEVTGLKARGNVEVDMAWDCAALTQAVLRPAVSNQALKVTGKGIGKATIADSAGNPVAYTAAGQDAIVFGAVAGEIYTISNFRDEKGIAEERTMLTDLLSSASETFADITPENALYNEQVSNTLQNAIEAAQTLNENSQSGYADLRKSREALSQILDEFRSFYYPTISFSAASGIFDGTQAVNAESIELSCNNEMVEIHYTTDGSDPSSDSETYTSSIPLPVGITEIRAAAFYNGQQLDTATAAKYAVLETENLSLDASITMEGYVISGYEAEKAIDGNVSSRVATNGSQASFTLVFKEEKTVSSMNLYEFVEANQTTRLTSARIEYWNGSEWILCAEYNPSEPGDHVFQALNDPSSKDASQLSRMCICFEPVSTEQMRIAFTGSEISIWELALHGSSPQAEPEEPEPTPTEVPTEAPTEAPAAAPTEAPTEPTPTAVEAGQNEPGTGEKDEGKTNTALVVLLSVLALAAIGTAAAVIISKKKSK